jgi:hypothetical protein
MSTQDRYTKIIESLVNGDEANASDLLHEAFVEKAREIWSGLVEQDDIAEDEIAEEELEEAIGDEEADDFLDDIETAEDEIESEEAFGEADDEEEGELDMDMDAEMELAADEEGEDGEDGGDIEDAMVSVEDALEDLKAAFAEMMGGASNDEPEMDDDEEMEEEFTFESEEDEELDESEETLEEAAELKKVGKEGMHPADMPAGDDGKHSPVAGKNDMGGKVINTGEKGSEGSSNGLSDTTAKDMNVTHPGDGAKLSPEARGHGAEKKGKTA